LLAPFKVLKQYRQRDKKDQTVKNNSLTTRATREALVVIYISHGLAGITGTSDLVATAQTLTYTTREKISNRETDCTDIYTIDSLLLLLIITSAK